MKMFYECNYYMRISYMIFLVITIMSLMFLLWILIRWKCEKRKIYCCLLIFVICFAFYVILLENHITPLDDLNRERHNTQMPISVLWVSTLVIFIETAVNIIKTNNKYKHTVTEENIKEAFDEVPLAICCFKEDGIPMLCNRRMQQISEIMCGKIFMSYIEWQKVLVQRKQWHYEGDIYRLPDGSVYRYVEDELVTRDGEHFLVANFFDITELDKRKTELEEQNAELRRMSVELLRLKENIRLLAKEEEMLTIKARWHDVLGEGLMTIRRAILSNQPKEDVDQVLKRWCDSVTTIQRDNDDPDQRRDAIGDLLRDAQGLQIKMFIDGQIPDDNKTQQVFVMAMRNCLLNAAQHAKASEIYVKITQIGDENILSVMNNGIEPKEKIVPQGGLINVKNSAESIGGRMEIQSLPEFELRVVVPKRG